jgi:catechol 2,3-dioxygenase-like lactoylglutathione lyase family enzyme
MLRTLLSIAIAATTLAAQTAPPNASGVGIGHIHLVVSDPEAQKKLFVGLLGAEVTNAGVLEMWKLPGVFIVVQQARTPPSGGTDGSTVNHFGFKVKSYQEMRAKLEAAHLTFTMDNAKTKQVIAEFPEKVRVEFTEDPDMKVPIAFHHIHIATPNQEALRAWYVKMFGAEEGKRGAFPAAMLPGGEVDFLKAAAAPAPTKGRSLDHIGFEIKGLEAYCKKLEAQGIPFDLTYREMPQIGGMKIAFVIDPEGTRIELTEGLVRY